MSSPWVMAARSSITTAAPGPPCTATHLIPSWHLGQFEERCLRRGEYSLACPPRNIVHYDGSAWSPMTSGTNYQSLSGIWGSSGNDVFAVGVAYGALGFAGTIIHYNGSAWSPMTSGTTQHLYGIWGCSGSDVFAVGNNGTVLHYNGSAWSPMTSGTTQHLYGIWGCSGSDVFAVGGGDNGNIILHFNFNVLFLPLLRKN